MLKILLIDDNEITIKYLKTYIMGFSGHEYDFSEATNYESAMLFLNDRFDIVLCDNKLGEDKHGIDFITDFSIRHKESVCLLYSADYDKMNKTYAKKIKCHSLAEIELELIALLENINETPLYGDAEMVQTIAGSYNKELCETLHKENEREHSTIREQVRNVNDSLKEVSRDIRDAIDKTREDNKKIFFVTIGVFATLVANLALSLIKG